MAPKERATRGGAATTGSKQRRQSVQADVRRTRRNRQRNSVLAPGVTDNLFNLPDPDAVLRRARRQPRARNAQAHGDTNQTSIQAEQHEQINQPNNEPQPGPDVAVGRQAQLHNSDAYPIDRTGDDEVPAPQSVQRAPSRVTINAPDVGHEVEALAADAAKAWGAGDMEALLHAAMRQQEMELLANEGRRWSRGFDVGHGSYGIARVYAELDAHNNVHARIVVKDAVIATHHWGSLEFWYPNAYSSDREPGEIAIMRRLAEQQDALSIRHCVRLHESTVFLDRHYFRLYMDYYEQRTLDQAIDLYGDHTVPEPVVWAIFDSLVNACLFLAFGHSEESLRPQGWRGIVHRDIKPANIFLTQFLVREGPDFDDEESDDESDKGAGRAFPGIPLAVLGDYGLAIMTDSDDVLNPLAYLGSGTEGWQAPEQLGIYNVRSLKMTDYKLDAKTNIWAIGKVILYVMLRPDGGFGAFSEQPDLTVPQHTRQTYSPELVRLVERCGLFNPSARIGPLELRREVDRLTAGPGAPADQQDLAQGARAAYQGVTLRTESSLLNAALLGEEQEAT